MTQRKNLAEVEWKADQLGSFRAIIASFNVVDRDADVTFPGAFPVGKRLPISAYGHASWDGGADNLPVGFAIIGADSSRAWADGQFFVETSHGLDTYKTVKALFESGAGQDFSYGFNPSETTFDPKDLAPFPGAVRGLRRVEPFEISPVLMGSGIGTGFQSIKSADLKRAIAPHSTATTDEAWDAGANVARIAADAGAAMLRRMYAWMDAEADPATKSAYKFPHHMVSADGAVGAANVRGCVAGIAVLNGGRGGADIPDADRMGVHRHLGAHMMDADMEPAELRAKSLRVNDHLAHVLRALPASIAYIEALTATKDGRVLSGDSLASIDSALAALDNALVALRELRARGVREEGDGKAAVQRLIRDAELDIIYRRLRAAG